MGVSSDPSCTPRILECFLLCDNAFPNTSPTMTPLETSLGHRTLWKEVFIFLRSKGNLWIRVSTDKGGCYLGPHWPDSQCTPIPPWGVHQGLSCGDGTHRLPSTPSARPKHSSASPGRGRGQGCCGPPEVGTQPGEEQGARPPAELSSRASGVSFLCSC